MNTVKRFLYRSEAGCWGIILQQGHFSAESFRTTEANFTKNESFRDVQDVGISSTLASHLARAGVRARVPTYHFHLLDLRIVYPGWNHQSFPTTGPFRK